MQYKKCFRFFYLWIYLFQENRQCIQGFNFNYENIYYTCIWTNRAERITRMFVSPTKCAPKLNLRDMKHLAPIFRRSNYSTRKV